MRYAHEHNLPRVVLGREAGRLRRPWQTRLAEAVGYLATDLDLLQVALPARDGVCRPYARRRWIANRPSNAGCGGFFNMAETAAASLDPEKKHLGAIGGTR